MPADDGDERQRIRIGTRRSLLARAQTDEVVTLLKSAWPSHVFEIHAMATAGDNNQSTALYKFNDKALWTQELEELLHNGELDMIVHSLKDMPTQLPADMVLGAVTVRNDPRDALIVKPGLAYRGLSEFSDGSVIGTSSLRRTAQLKRFFPKLNFAVIRGNIVTRLAKLDDSESEYTAIILATAGLARIGMKDRITAYLTRENGGMLYAVGQGALGIEVKENDRRLDELLAPVIHEPTFRATLAERSLMRTLEGGCSVPIGVETRWLSPVASAATMPADSREQHGKISEWSSEAANSVPSMHDDLEMRAIVVSVDGHAVAEAEASRRIASREDADDFGRYVAQLLIQNGADKILAKIQLDRDIIAAQGNA